MAYVYQHIRLDKNEIFYIGIGSDNNYQRAHKYGRNKHWNNVVNKTEYTVEIIYDNLTWNDACEKEKELIKRYGRFDLNTGHLTNKTDGGDSNFGFVFTEEHKAKLRKAHTGKKLSKEHCEKISKSNKGHKNYNLIVTEETKRKMSKALKGKASWIKGLKMTNEHKLKIGKANTGKKLSKETKMKLSKVHIGKKLSATTKKKLSLMNKGKKLSQETKDKIAQAQLGKKRPRRS